VSTVGTGAAPVRAAGTVAAVVLLGAVAVSTASVVARTGPEAGRPAPGRAGPGSALSGSAPTGSAPTGSAAAGTAAAGTPLAARPGRPAWWPVGSGELGPDWADWSWSAVVTRGRPGPGGAAAIRVDLTDGYAGFSLRRAAPAGPAAGATARARVWVDGGGAVLSLTVQADDDRPGRHGPDVTVTGGHWVVLALPVGPGPVKRVTVERRGTGPVPGPVRVWVAEMVVS
jgi:hypothetical protein